MNERNDIPDKIRSVASKRRLFLAHAVHQMSRPERMIKASEVQSVIEKGEIIEEYSEDPRGYSCLLLGRGRDGRPIHVVCAPKEDYLAIITAYLPDPREWSSDFKERKTS
jgi:hypothetical protein